MQYGGVLFLFPSIEVSTMSKIDSVISANFFFVFSLLSHPPVIVACSFPLIYPGFVQYGGVIKGRNGEDIYYLL